MKKKRISVYIQYFNQCDKKKCSSMRLYRLYQRGNFKELVVTIDTHPPRNEVVLDPTADAVLSPQDRDFVLRSGIAVIDCSWKQFLSIQRRHHSLSRSLPYLLASNPVNYGKPYHLNSAEAIIATLYIVGFKRLAQKIDEKFPGKFIVLNKEPLEEYSRCQNQEEVLKVAQQFMPLLDDPQ